MSRESGPPNIGKGRHDLAAAKRQDRTNGIAEVGQDTQGARGQDTQGARGLTSLPEHSERQMSCLDAEAAYIGALMWHPAESAAQMAALVEPEDLSDARLRVVLQIVRDVAAGGVAPDPVAVLAHARRTAAVSTTHAVKQLAELVAELYGAVPLPTSVDVYAGAVLDGALRRRCALLGERVAQVAETASLATLVSLVGSEVLEVFALRDRRAAVLAGLGMPVQELAA